MLVYYLNIIKEIFFSLEFKIQSLLENYIKYHVFDNTSKRNSKKYTVI